MPKISIIVPVYNTEKYIKKCLNSLVNQTLKDIEIIVVNDGSTDKSETIIKEYEQKYMKKIKYLVKKNGGLSDARNYGIKYATGEYVGFVDSDDYVSETMYEKLYNKAIKTGAELVECNVKWIYEKKEKIDAIEEITKKEDYFIYGRVMACNKIIKRKSLQENNIMFPIGLRYEDVELYYKLIPYINKMSLVKENMYYYIQRQNSIANIQNEKTMDIFNILEKIIKYYKENNIYQAFEKELEYLYIRFLFGSSFLRITKIKNKEIKKEALRKTWEEINNKFPNWKNNKYLRNIKTKKNLYYKTINKFTFKIYSIIFSIR